MIKFNFNIHYTNKTENTELLVGANFESSEQQNDQSSKGMLGLILDCAPLVVKLFSYVPVFLDTISQIF